jgi:dephospho-CoA kinase
MLRVGLTGGIGSGKSTVLSMLAGFGAGTIDADAISREVTAPGGAAIPAITGRFGADFIAADGSLDRARMRQEVYADPAARQALESVIHPLVAQESARLVAAA